jgi:hypothetical protein
MMTRRHLLMFLLVAPTAACYSYVDSSFDTVAPGSEIRVEVDAETATRLQEALSGDLRSVEGHVQSREDGVLLLEVVAATRQVGFQFEALRQTLHLERTEVTNVQLKILDRSRTIAGIALAGVAVGAIAWKALGGNTGGDTSPPTGPGPADAWVVPPLFRIAVPFF